MTQAAAQTASYGTDADPGFDLATLNRELESSSAERRVSWALGNFPGRVVLTSSFGAQSAVCLHLVVTQQPAIPVVLVDTGYLFPETYRFIDELSERLALNLHIYRATYGPAWQEARYGKLWEQGLAGIERYNLINKVEPMQRALKDLGAAAWISGLRRQQAKSRQHLDVLLWRNGRCKIHPLIDWTDRDVYRYLTQHGLPYHPLWEQGYVSIGDVHTTRRLVDGMSPEETRFFGLKRECGLHEQV